MTRSEFHQALLDEFGELQSRVLVNQLVLGGLAGDTAQSALERGVAPKVVWAALCDAMDVPESRRYGVGIARPPARS